MRHSMRHVWSSCASPFQLWYMTFRLAEVGQIDVIAMLCEGFAEGFLLV